MWVFKQPDKSMFLDWRGYLIGIAAVALATWLKYLAQPDIIPARAPILYIAVIVPVAIFFGLGPSLLVCLLSVLAFDYFFIPPVHSFITIVTLENVPILVIFFAVGVVLSFLSSNLRQRTQEAVQDAALRREHEVDLEKYRAHLEDLVKERTNQLEKERNLLQTIMDSAGKSHLVFLDRDFNFVRVNNTYAQTCGYKPEEMIGKNHFALYPHKENEAIFARVRDTGIAEEYHDKPFEFPDQPERGVTYWDWTLTPIKSVQGQVEGLVFSLTETTERKQAEEALKESEKRLQLSQEIAHVGTFDWNIQTGVNVWTPQLESMYGLPPGGFAGTQPAWENLVYSEDLAKATQLVEQTLKSGAPVEGEWRVQWPDGSIHWIMGRFQAFKDFSGKPLRMIGVNVDFTEQMRAEEALKKSEEQYRSIFASNIGGIAFWRADGYLTEINQAFCEILGCTIDEVRSGQIKWTDFTPPEMLPRDQQAIEEINTKGYCIPYEKEFVRRNGQRVQVLISGAMVGKIRDQGLAFAFDITERKQAEANNLFLSAIVESSDDAIIGKTLEGIITSWNQGAEKIYGYARDEVMGKPITMLSPPDRFEEVHQLLEQIKQGKRVQNYETERVKKGGTKIHVSLTVSPIVNDQNQIIGASTIARDITERKQAEEALARAKNELEMRVQERTAELNAANEQLQHYLGEVIQAQERERKRLARELHDDTAPSLSILGLELESVLAKGSGLTEETRQRLSALKEKMNTTQQDIRRFSHELHPSVLDNLGLEPALDTLVAEINDSLGMSIEFEASGDGETLSDEVKLALYRIAQEALNNVRKHSQAAWASVNLEYSDSLVKLSVMDNGKGFDHSQKIKGGLGLIGMQERANLVGAKLSIESKPGQGTKVTVELEL